MNAQNSVPSEDNPSIGSSLIGIPSTEITSIDMPVIEVRDAVKKFGRTTALNGLDLTVGSGEIRGFLGPNGAGKSTTIRALLGQISLNSGYARVFGMDCRREAVEVHRRIAYVPGDVELWPTLSGGECISILGRLNDQKHSKRLDELIERFRLDPTKKVSTYSKGNRQKVALCAALSSDAEVLLLDEPTSGLDPLMEKVFQEVIQETVRDGDRTVLLSSHILSEVEVLCEYFSIVRDGKTVSTGTLDDLRSRSLTRVNWHSPQEIEELRGMSGVSRLVQEQTIEGVRGQFEVVQSSLPEAVGLVVKHQPSTLTVEPPSLDELFLERYRTEEYEPDISAPTAGAGRDRNAPTAGAGRDRNAPTAGKKLTS